MGQPNRRDPPPPSSPPSRLAELTRLCFRVQVRESTATARISSPPRDRPRRYTCEHFLSACAKLVEHADAMFAHGTCIVGNGRSVLGSGAGPAIDKFGTVIRFNDYQIDNFEQDVGSKTDLWVVSDWT